MLLAMLAPVAPELTEIPTEPFALVVITPSFVAVLPKEVALEAEMRMPSELLNSVLIVPVAVLVTVLPPFCERPFTPNEIP